MRDWPEILTLEKIQAALQSLVDGYEVIQVNDRTEKDIAGDPPIEVGPRRRTLVIELVERPLA